MRVVGVLRYNISMIIQLHKNLRDFLFLEIIIQNIHHIIFFPRHVKKFTLRSGCFFRAYYLSSGKNKRIRQKQVGVILMKAQGAIH